MEKNHSKKYHRELYYALQGLVEYVSAQWEEDWDNRPNHLREAEDILKATKTNILKFGTSGITTLVRTSQVMAINNGAKVGATSTVPIAVNAASHPSS